MNIHISLGSVFKSNISSVITDGEEAWGWGAAWASGGQAGTCTVYQSLSPGLECPPWSWTHPGSWEGGVGRQREFGSGPLVTLYTQLPTALPPHGNKPPSLRALRCTPVVPGPLEQENGKVPSPHCCWVSLGQDWTHTHSSCPEGLAMAGAFLGSPRGPDKPLLPTFWNAETGLVHPSRNAKTQGGPPHVNRVPRTPTS